MPLTDVGLEPRTLAEIVEDLTTELRSTISAKLTLNERTVLGNVLNIFADHIDQVESLQGELHDAYDPDNATDDRLVALALISGVKRRGAQKGLVTATINLDAGAAIPAGALIAHVVGDAANRWVNRLEIPAHGAGNSEVVFESESAGASFIAPASTLTQIATPFSGWNTITNASDATAGTDIEAVEALRLRRDLAVAAGGSRTRGALQAQLVNLDGVISVQVFENKTSAIDADGLPPHSFRAVIWDGVPNAVSNDAIAQTILDFGPLGILSEGDLTGIAVDDSLGNVTIAFRRATFFVVTAAITISASVDVAIDDIKAAMIAAMPATVGSGVTYNKILCAALDVPGVDDVTALTLNGASTDLPALITTIYGMDTSSITVSGDVV